MDTEEIERVFPAFREWVDKEYGYADGIRLIKIWHEFLIECNYDPTEI